MRGARREVGGGGGLGLRRDGRGRARGAARAWSRRARAAGMRLYGPNTQGLANFGTGAIAGFSTMFVEVPPADGPVGIVSQSGGMCAMAYGLLRGRGLGVRHVHATGNEADVTVADLAWAVAHDPDVKLLLLYLESDRRSRAAGAHRRLCARARPADHRGQGRALGQRPEGGVVAHRLAGQRGPHGRRLLPPPRHLAGARPACAGAGGRGLPEGLAARGPAAGGHQQLRRELRDGRRCLGGLRPAAGRAGARHARRRGRRLPGFATAVNPIDITAALLSNSGLFGDVLPAVARDPAADLFFINIPVAGAGYDVEAFARDTAAFARNTGKPVVVAAWQESVAAPFRAQGIPTYRQRERRPGHAGATGLAHGVDAPRRRAVAGGRRARAAGRHRPLPGRGAEPGGAGRRRRPGGGAPPVPQRRRGARGAGRGGRAGGRQGLLARRAAQVGARPGGAGRRARAAEAARAVRAPVGASWPRWARRRTA